MHHLIAELIDRLDKFAVRYEVTQSELTVPASSPDGFEVDLTIAGNEAVVTFDGGWHEEFAVIEWERAQLLFMLALTDAARLKVTSRRAIAHRWTFETRVQGRWGAAGTTALIFVPFWRKTFQRYLINGYIPVARLVPWIPERFLISKEPQ